MNKLLTVSGFLVVLLGSSTVFAKQEAYVIDPEHSFTNWSVCHVVAKTSGTFSDMQGKLLIDADNLENSSIDVSINMLSVNSSHAKRDAHIVKEDYLDAKRFGKATFVSSKVVVSSATEGEITGKLTLHGVTRELTLPFSVLGFGDDPWGGYRVGLEASTTIKASDFGFGWSKTGPVGDEVELTLLIEAKRL